MEGFIIDGDGSRFPGEDVVNEVLQEIGVMCSFKKSALFLFSNEISRAAVCELTWYTPMLIQSIITPLLCQLHMIFSRLIEVIYTTHQSLKAFAFQLLLKILHKRRLAGSLNAIDTDDKWPG